MAPASLLQRLEAGVLRFSVRQWAVFLFTASFLLRLYLAATREYFVALEGGEMEFVAKNIVTNGTYANPFGLPTGPTAHTAPAYTYFIAALFHLFGVTPLAETVRVLFHILACSLLFALLPAWSIRAGLGLLAGVTAGLFTALLPLQSYMDCKMAFEQPWAALLLGVMTYRLMGQLQTPDWSASRAAVDGAVTGFATLLTPPLAFAAVAGALAEWWRHRDSRGAVLRRTTIAAAIALAVLTPWTIRNYQVFGKLLFVRGNAGLEIRTAFNDYAVTDMESDEYQVMHGSMHPHSNGTEALKVREMGEINYNQMMSSQAKEWVMAHPGKALSLVAGNVFRFWFPHTDRKRWRAAAFCAMSPFYTWALWVLWRRRSEFQIFWLTLPAIALSLPLVCLLKTSIRYRHPVFWVFALLMTFGIMDIGRKLLNFQKNRLGPATN